MQFDTRNSADVVHSNCELSFSALFSSLSEPVFVIDREGLILQANKAFFSRVGKNQQECLGKNYYGLLLPEVARQQLALMQEVLSRNKTVVWDDEWDGEVLRNTVYPSLSAQGEINQLVVISQKISDITQLVKKEQLFSRSVIESIPGVFYVIDASGKLRIWNSYIRNQVVGKPESEMPNIIGLEHIHPDDRPMMAEKITMIMTSGEELTTEARVLLHGGPEFRTFLMTGNRMMINGNISLVGVGVDITERKQAEDSLRKTNERFNQVISNMNDVVWSASLDGSLSDVNNAFEKIYGISAEELYAKPELWLEMVHPDDRQIAKASSEDLLKNGHAESEYRIVTPDGTVRWLYDRKSVYFDQNHVPVNINGIGFDITPLKLAEEELRRQLQRMRAIREIDLAIRGTTDIYLALKSVLEYTISELEVDAADFFLFDSHSNTLRLMVDRGFRSRQVEREEMKLKAEEFAAWLLEQKVLHISNLKEAESDYISRSLIEREGFIAYYAIPLIVKGNIIGLFELFQRKSLLLNQDWLDFLHTLAGQASIAIEDYHLFRELSNANQELLHAYDATIGGWSHALDMRDEETEGHSLRVTEMTLKLARAAGIEDKELVHIRRGALLHDIGKMGLPDTILLKQEGLTDEESEVMRQHPFFAFKLLSPIAYLRLAIDIPYCHHEKWDGSGYPRGLKGKEIPLAARLFAVVDVWDAMQSDRPYRRGLPKQALIEHIKSLSGTHFDPDIVALFLQMIATGELP